MGFGGHSGDVLLDGMEGGLPFGPSFLMGREPYLSLDPLVDEGSKGFVVSGEKGDGPVAPWQGWVFLVFKYGSHIGQGPAGGEDWVAPCFLDHFVEKGEEVWDGKVDPIGQAIWSWC